MAVNESEIISQVVHLLSKNTECSTRFKADIMALQDRMRICEANKYRLAVLGVTSSGKSTLLNALLGRQLLPSSAIPSSSQLVSCAKGKEWKGTVYFEDDVPKEFRDNQLTPQVIQQYGEEKYNPGNKKKVREIEILSPELNIPENLVIEDSPGLDAYGLEGHEHITMHMLLPSTDFCIFVTTCKTNSDNKTLEVLNEIARYGKHVIIIQNMIDSIKPSPDGKESVEDVAAQHIKRLQRIVDRSNISNKGLVHIVQVSAMWAMAVRLYLIKNKYHNTKSREIWAKSNFDEFLKVISQVFEIIKPEIEQKRLISLRRELEEISERIQPKVVSGAAPKKVDYSGILATLNSKVNNVYQTVQCINDQISSLFDYYSVTSKCTSESVERIKTSDASLANSFANAISDFNNALNRACDSLNIAQRDFAVRVPTKRSRDMKAAYTMETYKVKKPGFWNSVRRFWGGENSSGWETKYRTIEDPKENQKRIGEYLLSASEDYTVRFDSWLNDVKKIFRKINDVITTKNAQQEAAKLAFENERLSQEELVSIKNRLGKIINDLPRRVESGHSSGETQHIAKRNFEKISISEELFNMVNIAKAITHRMHQTVWCQLLGEAGCNIFTWDKSSCMSFIDTALDFDYHKFDTSPVVYSSKFGKIRVLDASLQPPKDLWGNIIFMVNATQPGAAKKELKSLLSKMNPGTYQNRSVFFIIQDLEEVITGGDLKGSVEDLNAFFNKLGFSNSYFLPNHSNPLYVISMSEAKQRNIKLHTDEMKLLSDLKKDLSYLFEEGSEQIISDLIRAQN